MNAIDLSDICRSYKGKVVISKISLSVEKGEFVSIIGPYGCGKTTLLKIIAGITEEYTGRVSIFGESPAKAKSDNLIGFGFQKPTLLPWLNVLENILLPGKLQGKDNEKKAKELLALIGLDKRENAKISELSGGMQKMVSIIRSLTLNPGILLLDEPFHSIDEISRDAIHDLVLKIHESTNRTTVLVTHSLVEAIYLSDKVVVLSRDPATIKAIVPIELSARNNETKYSEEVLNYAQKLRKILAS